MYQSTVPYSLLVYSLQHLSALAALDIPPVFLPCLDSIAFGVWHISYLRTAQGTPRPSAGLQNVTLDVALIIVLYFMFMLVGCGCGKVVVPDDL